MGEQVTKKVVSISIKRARPFEPRFVIVTGFKLRLDKSQALIEIFLETTDKKGVKIIFDPVLLSNNHSHLKTYVSAVPIDPDESAIREDVFSTEQTSFANVIHMSRIGTRGETMFGIFSLLDWVNESRQSTRTIGDVTSHDSVVVISTAAVQKKLIIELVLLFNQLKETMEVR